MNELAATVPIGSDGVSLGQKALELLLAQLDGETVESALVPTKLYGRMSLDYEAYDYRSIDLMNVGEAFIDRMFDECFYRYKKNPTCCIKNDGR